MKFNRKLHQLICNIASKQWLRQITIFIGHGLLCISCDQRHVSGFAFFLPNAKEF